MLDIAGDQTRYLFLVKADYTGLRHNIQEQETYKMLFEGAANKEHTWTDKQRVPLFY